MTDPNPALGVDGHPVDPIATRLKVEFFTEINFYFF